MTSSNDGAQKIAQFLKPLLDEVKKDINLHTTTATQELILNVQQLSDRITMLEKVQGEKKKAPRAEKKQVEANTTAASSSESGGAPAVKLVPANKLTYFREQFKTDPEFRKRFLTPELAAMAEKDPGIANKKNDLAKYSAMAGWLWKYFNNNPPTDGKPNPIHIIEEEYKKLKKEAESGKQQQQNVEPNTPK